MNAVPITPTAPLRAIPAYRVVDDPQRVLLAEDDDAMRTLLAEELRARGYHVMEAANASELQDWLEQAYFHDGAEPPPDLIISDVRMPGGSGLDVLSWLRRFDWRTPVVLITAFGDVETHAEAHRLGAAAMLDKPFEVEDLLQAVAAHSAPM